MSTAASRPVRRAAALPRELRMQCWPLRDDGMWPWLALIGGGAIAAGVGLAVQSVLMGLLAAAALNLSLWRLWLPVEYELGPSGVYETVLSRRRKISWKLIGGYEISGRGVRLFPKHGATRMLASRWIYLRGGTRHEELCELVKFYLSPRQPD